LADAFQRHVAGALDGPFIILFEQQSSDEPLRFEIRLDDHEPRMLVAPHIDQETALDNIWPETRGSFQHSAQFDFRYAALLWMSGHVCEERVRPRSARRERDGECQRRSPEMSLRKRATGAGLQVPLVGDGSPLVGKLI